MTTNSLLLSTILSALALVATALSAQEVERLRGPEVAVYNLAGRMEIVRGEGTDVVVRVSRGGDDAATLRLETGEIRGRQTLRVVYPGDEIVYPELGRRARTEVRVDADGTFSDGGEGGDRVTIRGSGDGIEAWADLVIEVPAGQRAAAYLGGGTVDARGVHGHLDIHTGVGAVTATDMAGELAIETGSGRVEVSSMIGNLNVDTGSGSIEVENLKGSDKVELDTGSGSVSVRALQASRLLVDTGSGNVDLEGVATPETEVDTGSGSVEVELLTDVDALKVDTGAGSVTVSVPAGLGATVEIDSGSGGIDVEDLTMEVRSVQWDHLSGRIGDGRGEIAIDTGAGRVRLVGN